jgi:hypothetical protein
MAWRSKKQTEFLRAFILAIAPVVASAFLSRSSLHFWQEAAFLLLLISFSYIAWLTISR